MKNLTFNSIIDECNIADTVKNLGREVDLLFSYKRRDSDIVEDALGALKWAIKVPHKKIKVVINKGWLTLTGYVNYNYQKECAEGAVEGIYGVNAITNNIKVKSTITSSFIKKNITKEFKCNTIIDVSNVKVLVDGSDVILKGSIKNFDADKEVRAIIWSIPGITSINDQLNF